MPKALHDSPEETKQVIIDAALERFGEKSVDAVSLKEIAEAANVSPALIHHCFGGKEGLKQAAIDNMYNKVQGLSRELIGLLTESGLDTIADVFDRATVIAFTFAREHKASVVLLQREVLARGRLDELRASSVHRPFLDGVTAGLGLILGVPAEGLLWPLHACIAIITRYALSPTCELMELTGAETPEDAVMRTEVNLQQAVRKLLSLPTT